MYKHIRTGEYIFISPSPIENYFLPTEVNYGLRGKPTQFQMVLFAELEKINKFWVKIIIIKMKKLPFNV